MDDKQAFWDEQAIKGKLSGTQDRYAKELEMATIARYVKDEMWVLDAGCGDGETLRYLADRYNIRGWGFDYSEEMIRKADNHKTDKDLYFIKMDLRDFKKIEHHRYDLIYTQRSLINLDTWEDQRQAIIDILSLLKPGGTYVMVECFVEGLEEINNLRLNIGLESIVPPWHNRYLSSNTLFKFLFEKNLWFEEIHFSGAYYFMSRIVNAWGSKNFGGEPEYDSSLNFLGKLLPPDCVNLRGQTQAWIIKKKEG